MRGALFPVTRKSTMGTSRITRSRWPRCANSPSRYEVVREHSLAAAAKFCRREPGLRLTGCGSLARVSQGGPQCLVSESQDGRIVRRGRLRYAGAECARLRTGKTDLWSEEGGGRICPPAAEPVDRLAGRLVVWHGYGADTRAKRVLDQVASATRCSASLCSRCVRAIPRSIAVPPDTSFTG